MVRVLRPTVCFLGFLFVHIWLRSSRVCGGQYFRRWLFAPPILVEVVSEVASSFMHIGSCWNC
jgi:hypothetical protein